MERKEQLGKFPTCALCSSPTFGGRCTTAIESQGQPLALAHLRMWRWPPPPALNTRRCIWQAGNQLFVNAVVMYITSE